MLLRSTRVVVIFYIYTYKHPICLHQRSAVHNEDVFLGPIPRNNIPISTMTPWKIHAKFSFVRNIMSSSIKTKLGGLFKNYQNTTSIKTTLQSNSISATTHRSGNTQLCIEYYCVWDRKTRSIWK